MSRWASDHEPVGFWTILFAVCGGVLLADLVRLAVAALMAGALLSAWNRDMETRTKQVHVPAREGQVVVGRPRAADPLLPGPIDARRSGISRACISGYIADRRGSGWTQRTPLERCIATSN